MIHKIIPAIGPPSAKIAPRARRNESLFDPQIIRQYVGDIIFTVLLGGLGVYTTLKDIFVETGKKHEETDVAEKPEVK